MPSFRKLFSSIKINNLTLPNRWVMTPMHLGYCPTGEVSDQLIEFYRVRAQGGVGLIIVGGCGIDKHGTAPGMIQVDDNHYIPGLKRLAETVHQEGPKIIAQLYHAGRYASSALTGHVPIAPSPVPSKLTGEIPHELTVAEIKDVTDSFVQGAKHIKEAGFDGVEVLAGTGYLISQFLSPLTNKRTDDYGGTLENRLRFASEIITSIRQTVGKDYPLLIRMAGNDFMPGGNTMKEAILIAQAFEKLGIDALSVTGGWHETSVPQITMNVPPGAFRYLARTIKQAVSIPVIASNRINTPELAEEILTLQEADLVGIARPLIADPHFPLKAYEKKTIRPCLGCNQGCLDQVFKLKPVRCVVNAEAGQEVVYSPKSPLDLGLLNTPTLPRQTNHNHHLLVIGAGAAGLEFSRLAALQGYRVTIWEETNLPGGQLHLAAAPPNRSDFLRLLKYLTQACADAGVNICYNIKATPETILAALAKEKFQKVIIAAGSKPSHPLLPIREGAQVVQAWDILKGHVLDGQESIGQNIIILGGGAVGIETALSLAKIGTINQQTLRFLLFHNAENPAELERLLTQGTRSISIIEIAKEMGRDIGPSTRWSMLADLKRHGVTIFQETKALEITPKHVYIERKGTRLLVPADTVIIATGSTPQDDLYRALKDEVNDLIVIGDSYQVSNMYGAIHSAYEAARNLQ